MDHCVFTSLLCLASVAALAYCHDHLSGSSEELSHVFLHSKPDRHGSDDEWQMGKIADMMKQIKYQKFMKHDDYEEHRRIMRPSSPRFLWKGGPRRSFDDNSKSGLFRQLMGVVKNVQQKKAIIGAHDELHSKIEAIEQLKKKVGAFRMHHDSHNFMDEVDSHHDSHHFMDGVDSHHDSRHFMDGVDSHHDSHHFMDGVDSHRDSHHFMDGVDSHHDSHNFMDSHHDSHHFMEGVDRHQDTHDFMDKHEDMHKFAEIVAAKKRMMEGMKKHEYMHRFVEALDRKKKAMEAMKKHEEIHRFVEALEAKKKMVEAMKKHEEFHDFLQMMSVYKEKLAHAKKHSQMHDYVDAEDDHHNHVMMMGKFNTMLAMHSQAHSEHNFGDQMMGLMSRKRQFVFTIVYELMKFCKCRESIENLHRFFNPDEFHAAASTGNNTSIMDIDDHVKFFHPRTLLQAKTMFMKGLVKTLCLTAKGYVKHVKMLAAHHLAHHFMLGGFSTDSKFGDDYGNGYVKDTGNTPRSSDGLNDGSQTNNGYRGSQTVNGYTGTQTMNI